MGPALAAPLADHVSEDLGEILVALIMRGRGDLLLNKPIELTNNICGGSGRNEDNAKFTRPRTPCKLASKLSRDILKLTGQAVGLFMNIGFGNLHVHTHRCG